MELIDKLYNLIEENNNKVTFTNNLELFKEFYKNKSIYFLQEFNNKKVFVIIKFMLENEEGEIFEYFHENMLNNLKHSFDKIAFNYHSKDIKATDLDIEYIFEMKARFEQIYELINNSNYQNKLDNYNKSAIKILDKDTFDRDILSSLILILNSGIFNISNENIFKTINYLNNNNWIKEYQNGNKKTDSLTRDFVYQYITKYLAIKDFSTISQNNDNLLESIFLGNLQDEKLIRQVIKEIDLTLIFENIYKNRIENLIMFLENNQYEETTNQVIFNSFMDNCLKKDIPIDIYNNNSIYIERYFTFNNKEENKKIILGLEPSKENEQIIFYFLKVVLNFMTDKVKSMI